MYKVFSVFTWLYASKTDDCNKQPKLYGCRSTKYKLTCAPLTIYESQIIEMRAVAYYISVAVFKVRSTINFQQPYKFTTSKNLKTEL